MLTVANNSLRVRIPQELLPKTPAAGEKAGPAPMTDDERRTAMREIMTEAGFQRGTPPTPDVIAKATKLAADPDPVRARRRKYWRLNWPRGAGRPLSNRCWILYFYRRQFPTFRNSRRLFLPAAMA